MGLHLHYGRDRYPLREQHEQREVDQMTASRGQENVYTTTPRVVFRIPLDLMMLGA